MARRLYCLVAHVYKSISHACLVARMSYIDEGVSRLGSTDEGKDIDLAARHDGWHRLAPRACPRGIRVRSEDFEWPLA